MRGPTAAALLVAGAAAALAPAAWAADDAGVRDAALDAAAAWRGTLEAVRAPVLPVPADAESVILVLAGVPASAVDAAGRPAAAAELAARQERLVGTLASLGATVTFRYRVLVNAVAVRVPAGRLEAIAALPEVRAIVPVTYLSPAQADAADPGAASPAAGAAAPVAGTGPAHIALIDAGVDVTHPWLGGGIGPTFPIVGGADLVDGDADPRPSDPSLEAHGTQMAGIVLRSPALAGLAPERVPRLLAYRVVAGEPVGGRMRPLARTDRVLAALERAVDPDGDGATADGADVILMGLAGAFGAGGADPVADALTAADRLGASVVVPVGNDGPTFARPGAVGGPAAAPTVIAVGGLGAPRAARTADLDVSLGPAAARLGGLPLTGPDPAPAELPVVVLGDDSGLSDGAAGEDFRTPEGASRVAGALVVVARRDAPVAEVADRAARAGAAALAVWDEDGGGAFPATAGAGVALPVVGLGARQGAALVGLGAGDPAMRVRLRGRAAAAAPPALASFSTWGPTVDGRQKPDLVAPAVDVPAAVPGIGPDGRPRTLPLTGTSAAAAEVAAIALRLRVDRPAIGPRAVRSALIQAARPLRGVATQRQGAGVAAAAAPVGVVIDPPIVATRRIRTGARATLTLRAPGPGGTYTLMLVRGGRTRPLVEGVGVASGRATRVSLSLPRGAGRLVVRDAAGATVAAAPVVPRRPAEAMPDALGRPEVDADGALVSVRVRLGLLRRAEGRIVTARLHGVRIDLVPVGGGPPLRVSGSKQRAAWPAGTYRFLIARRLASGLEVPRGRYRVRVSARAVDGSRVRRDSPPFRLV